MPTYCHVCPSCGRAVETVCSIRDCHDRVCECGTAMNRDYRAERANVGDREYRRPIVSSSLAINPNQIAEHRQLFPDVQVTPEGQPIFTSYRQHDAYLKKCGFTKQPQKIRNKGKRIATRGK